MANTREATECHRRSQDFYLTDAQVESSLLDSIELSPRSIPTNRFSENPVTVYAFGESAGQYGQFLREAGVNEMPIVLASLQDKPFARPMWFYRLGNDYGSGLNGSYRDLDYDFLVRGVRHGGEATEQKFDLVSRLNS